jgi:hypothetical protein
LAIYFRDVEARFSLHARLVVIELVAVPITGRVSG